MAGLYSLLPPPTQHVYDRGNEETVQKVSKAVVATGSSSAPPYGRRKGWIPRSQEDFGDGGAFPEIQVAQYPLGLGKKSEKSNALAVQVDQHGKIKYDAIARHGHSKDKVVHSKFTDLVPKTLEDGDPALERPDEETIEENTEKTRNALEKIVDSTISAAMPVHCAEKQAPAQYIRYTPSQEGAAYNSGAKQRIIRMVEVQVDPMEPPRFKTNKKIPRGPPSPPAPVMHSPNRKVTVKEQQEWKIPPCISNWKNNRGYTIPLDKRLAADGKGLQGVHINENFAKLAEALYIADRKAREAVEMRAQIEKKMAEKEKEKKEEGLRKLAEKARDSRIGLVRHSNKEKDDDLEERDNLRRDRQRERQRERNLANAAPDKRNRIRREQDRDVSELIALGKPSTAGRSDPDSQFDQRLFNQSKGMSSGFGDDDAYNVYDKAWRQDSNIGNSIYRPSKNIDKDNYGDDLDNLIKSNRFVADKKFAGTEGAPSRDGPVQFSKDEDEEDPFGLQKFLTEAKKAKKRPTEETHRSSRDHDKGKRRRE